MTRSLPDVNVLLALAWPNHQHHAAALSWFRRDSRKGWATCAITELAFLRLSSNPAFTRFAVEPPAALELLKRLVALPGHAYWEELPSASLLFGLSIVGHQQVNDAYLVRVVEKRRGRIVTFDGALRLHAASPRTVTVLTA